MLDEAPANGKVVLIQPDRGGLRFSGLRDENKVDRPERGDEFGAGAGGENRFRRIENHHGQSIRLGARLLDALNMPGEKGIEVPLKDAKARL